MGKRTNAGRRLWLYGNDVTRSYELRFDCPGYEVIVTGSRSGFTERERINVRVRWHDPCGRTDDLGGFDYPHKSGGNAQTLKGIVNRMMVRQYGQPQWNGQRLVFPAEPKKEGEDV